jgi:hypothetical protein
MKRLKLVFVVTLLMGIMFIFVFQSRTDNFQPDISDTIIRVLHVSDTNPKEKWYDFCLFRNGSAILKQYDMTKKGWVVKTTHFEAANRDEILKLYKSLASISPPKNLSLHGASTTTVQVFGSVGLIYEFSVPNPSNGQLSWGDLPLPYVGQDLENDRYRMAFLKKLNQLINEIKP